MNTRKNRNKRPISIREDYVAELDETSNSPRNDSDDQEQARKSRIRDSNKEFARRMTILQTWSEYWVDFTTRDGEAYPQQQAREIIRKTKKITCPIETCNKSFTSIGGLKYHYARCNITRCFKCKLCDPVAEYNTRGEILRHMILQHYDDLPALNDDQKEIANSYLSCENKTEKSKKIKRAGTDSEASSSSQYLIKAFHDLQERVFSPDSHSNRFFKDWELFINDWEAMTSEYDRKQYHPPELESVKFKLHSEDEWKVLKIGESTTLMKDKRGLSVSTTFFTGGINTASAWLPKSHEDSLSNITPDLIAISVNSCSMERSLTYKDSITAGGCIQFWNVHELAQGDDCDMTAKLNYAIGHSYGTIFEMRWCPMGTSWQAQPEAGGAISRLGLLALACGDGQVRILNIPHTGTLLDKVKNRSYESIPLFKTKPIATLMPPGAGSSTDCRSFACISICWSLESNQRYIAAGYTNGIVALFDLATSSPILSTSIAGRYVYQPLKSWIAHGAPVTSVAMLSKGSIGKTLIGTGSTDRQLKVWSPSDLGSCITTDRAPITKILWDYRFRGIVTATDTAFTSFNNRVSYRYPSADGHQTITVSAHRSTVWGLANSIITNAFATADGAGELFVVPQLINKSLHRSRDRNILSTHSLYTLVPRALGSICSSNQLTNCASGSDSNGVIATNQDISATQAVLNTTNNETDENGIFPDADFKVVEREIANKPNKFLLPIEHSPVETYFDFKDSFGLEFINYNQTVTDLDSKLPDSCVRAGDTKNIYCERPCDYPFSRINDVSWSPNASSFSYLFSGTQVGLCRLDKVQIIEQINKVNVDSILLQNQQQ